MLSRVLGLAVTDGEPDVHVGKEQDKAGGAGTGYGMDGAASTAERNKQSSASFH